MDFKENVINFFSISALHRGPVVWHSRAANWRPLLYRVSHIIDTDKLRMLYCALLQPYITYCCSVWGSPYKMVIWIES